jgi:glutathione S-transferase
MDAAGVAARGHQQRAFDPAPPCWQGAGPVIRVYRIPWSTNVERVALALAHKGVAAEPVDVDPSDRSALVDLSGQDLVPVLERDGRIVADSPAIFELLEAEYPDPPLYPADARRRAETDVFIDWFNRVWKIAPNAIADELQTDAPDQERIAAWSAELAGALHRFEDLLDGRDFLMGDSVSAADLIAFPFLKYATLPPDPADDEVFHHVLHDRQRLGDDHPRLAAWIERIDALPRAF